MERYAISKRVPLLSIVLVSIRHAQSNLKLACRRSDLKYRRDTNFETDSRRDYSGKRQRAAFEDLARVCLLESSRFGEAVFFLFRTTPFFFAALLTE
jgi:hypothetical protein